ncbi:MAG: nuclear transport factor 2 family protein, partial [Anaerolineae bacterium]|nr:nuclear transport factor 2 family protein [Anaerolineae bacterium]
AVVTDAINAVWREYEASQLAGDPDRWIALWAEDGVQMPPGSPPVVGKAAIDTRDREDLAVNEYSEFTIENEEVEVSGDLAFARGTFKVTVAAKSGGEPMHFEGKYTTIFRQQPDGTWKIYRDTFNSNE